MNLRHALLTCILSSAMSAPALAADADSTATKRPSWLPTVSGTIRAKAEYQTEEGEGRFEVRNARVALDGRVSPIVFYKAEIDLSDEGQIKMLDAFAGIEPVKKLKLTLGQMRVPFSIDAHRSPHVQLFANRSFIAKQVGNVRDVGFMAAYTLPTVPLTLSGGIFNGSGLTGQKNYWTKSVNFSAKAVYAPLSWLTLEASCQKVRPTGGNVWLFDGGITLQHGPWMAEAEYLRKRYDGAAFPAVNAFDAFVSYSIPVRRFFNRASFLVRYDQMDDHSDGNVNDEGLLTVTDAARKRITGGITLSFIRAFRADLRLNYEKYFYDDKSLAKTSERDKAVVELMVHF